jgi:GNAT superfamily N-acetyltransferase
MKKLIKKLLKEVIEKEITCKNCSWTWMESTSEPHDLYNCHKCGYDNKKDYLNESVKKEILDDIESDELYDKLVDDVNNLRNNSKEVSFGLADVYEVIYDTKTNELIGASWFELSNIFSFHIIIVDEYRSKGFGSLLIDSAMKQYEKEKNKRSGDYPIRLNVVNDLLVNKLINKYNLKIGQKNNNGVILINEKYNIKNELRKKLIKLYF